MKPLTAKGTRDFSPNEVNKRNYISSIIKKQFQLFGFLPIETPSFENKDTLLGKYGEEGDRLIFKILKSGDYLNKVDEGVYAEKNSNKLASSICDKALRYDLTVPFARYIVQHQNEIDFPFKRYQIQPVWRADRPQKGRYREFYQCDADVVGSNSLWQEIEFVQLYDQVFSSLGISGVTIRLNHRRILSGLAEVIGIKEQLIDFTVALDKLDKIGIEGVKKEMISKGISLIAIEKITPLFSLKGSFSDQLKQLKAILIDSEEGLKGIEDLQFIIDTVDTLKLQNATLKLDVTLARGLNYYTGTIFEVTPPSSISIGSIGGGGRYDELTSIFGLKGMSGVGISFGLDRIYLVLEALSLFPETINSAPKALFINFGNKEALHSFKIIKQLRAHDICVEIYPDATKMNKQLKYANKRSIPYVILLGDEEIQNNSFTVKDMNTGHQENVNFEHLINILQ